MYSSIKTILLIITLGAVLSILSFFLMYMFGIINSYFNPSSWVFVGVIMGAIINIPFLFILSMIYILWRKAKVQKKQSTTPFFPEVTFISIGVPVGMLLAALFYVYVISTRLLINTDIGEYFIFPIYCLFLLSSLVLSIKIAKAFKNMK